MLTQADLSLFTLPTNLFLFKLHYKLKPRKFRTRFFPQWLFHLDCCGYVIKGFIRWLLKKNGKCYIKDDFLHFAVVVFVKLILLNMKSFFVGRMKIFSLKHPNSMKFPKLWKQTRLKCFITQGKIRYNISIINHLISKLFIKCCLTIRPSFDKNIF